jgi:5'-deoxynucleotidase YfbR-like HD superfamily hydrolase
MTQADTLSPDLFMDHQQLTGILEFLQAAEQLKDTIRSGSTRKGRPESTAEHSWRLALMCILFENELSGFDISKLLKLCLIHDLGEAISGDIPAPLQVPGDDRVARERLDFQKLCAPLPGDLKSDLIELWDEYAAASSPEARLAKAFDKLETMLQHKLMPLQNTAFYEFNLHYGRGQTDHHPLTRQIRDIVDDGTRGILRKLEATSAPPMQLSADENPTQ